MDGIITKYNGRGGDVVIPEQIGGQKISGIGPKAFATCRINSVKIPDSVTFIGELAFENNDLSKITIGANVTMVGDPFPIYSMTGDGRRGEAYNAQTAPVYTFMYHYSRRGAGTYTLNRRAINIGMGSPWTYSVQ